MNAKHILAAVSISLAMASGAHATLLSGNTVGFNYYKPNLASSYAYSDNGNYVVGNNVEVLNVADRLATLDISDSSILITFLAPPMFSPSAGSFFSAAFNGFVLTDILHAIDAFTSVSINPATNMVGFDISRISFDDDNIWVNWGGLAYTRGTTIVQLDINKTSQQVPEPGTLALAGIALLAMTKRLRKTA